MLNLARFEDDFYEEYNRQPRDIIVYGAGNGYLEMKDKLPEQYILVDRNWGKIKSLDGVEVCPIEKI